MTSVVQEDGAKTLLLPDEELLIKDELERLGDEDSNPPSSMSSRHSHEDDEDKMPEEAFMKYTTDSRTVTPVPSGPRDMAETEAQDKKPIKVNLPLLSLITHVLNTINYN